VETVKLNAIDGTQINAASDVDFTIGTFDLLTNGTNIQSNNSTVTIASGVDGVTAWNVDGSIYTLGTWAGGAGDDFKVTYDEDKDVIKVQRLALDANVTGTVADNDRWKFMGAAEKVSGEYFVDSQIKGILTI